MHPAHVRCPACNTDLALPAGRGDWKVGCARCGHKFRVRISVHSPSEDDVAGWLMAGHDRDTEEPTEPSATVAGIPIAKPDDTMAGGVLPGTGATPEPIRLVKVGHRGALFEFPAGRLEELTFRCAMPRRCLRCGARSHLRAHVVIYAPELRDSVSLEDEHAAGALALSEADVSDLSREEILSRLPRVPNVPSPANNPMPYWTCDMCSGTGTISGQISVNSETGEGWCRLLVRNLRRAEEFFVSAGGKGTSGHRSLLEEIEARTENPWDTLPEVVQHRIQQWFRAMGDERFIAYIPDRARSRTEDGMVGLLISTRRLIHQTPMRHRESKVSEPLELQLAQGGGRGHVRIKTPKWELRRITVDRNGLTALRRALSVGKFKAHWQ